MFGVVEELEKETGKPLVIDPRISFRGNDLEFVGRPLLPQLFAFELRVYIIDSTIFSIAISAVYIVEDTPQIVQ